MGRYAYGHIPSPPHKIGLGHPFHLSLPSLPASVALQMPDALDQGRASACTGRAGSVIIQAAGGRPWAALPSSRFLYGLARARGGYLPLTDSGAQIADIFGVAGETGFPAESAMPYTDDPIVINQMPTIESLREAIAQAPIMVRGAWRIMSTGRVRLNDVMSALAIGNRVMWGTELDLPFEELGPDDVWPGVQKAVEGGHAMVLHGYDQWTKTKVKLASRSSWTSGFADNGSGWVSEDAIMSPRASDFWVVSVVPRIEVPE